MCGTGIKWNAARFFYADVKLCGQNVEDSILVPAAADDNVPMKSSFDVKFGTSFPAGVTVTERGTSTNETVPFLWRHADNLFCVQLHGASRYTYDSADEDTTTATDEERESLIEQALAEMQAARLSGELWDYHIFVDRIWLCGSVVNDMSATIVSRVY